MKIHSLIMKFKLDANILQQVHDLNQLGMRQKKWHRNAAIHILTRKGRKDN